MEHWNGCIACRTAPWRHERQAWHSWDRYAAAATPSGGPTFAEPPSETLQLRARNLRFEPARVEIGDGVAIAVFLTNGDPLPHSFDSDALGLHVAMPAKSTVVALLKASPGGTLTFYCGIPGHQKAGMVGTIAVK